MAHHSSSTEPVDQAHEDRATAFQFVAVSEVGACLTDLCTLLLQRSKGIVGLVSAGGIAMGLERAAAHVRGQAYVPPNKDEAPKQIPALALNEHPVVEHPVADLPEPVSSAEALHAMGIDLSA